MAEKSYGRRPWTFYVLATLFTCFVIFLYAPMIAIYILSFQGSTGACRATTPLQQFQGYSQGALRGCPDTSEQLRRLGGVGVSAVGEFDQQRQRLQRRSEVVSQSGQGLPVRVRRCHGDRAHDAHDAAAWAAQRAGRPDELKRRPGIAWQHEDGLHRTFLPPGAAQWHVLLVYWLAVRGL